MRRRTFIHVTAGTAATLAFPPGRPTPPESGNRVRQKDRQAGDQPMTHPVVHFEIGCRDSAKTQEFYRKLFDWKISDLGPAAMIAAESGGIGRPRYRAGARTAALHDFLRGRGRCRRVPGK